MTDAAARPTALGPLPLDNSGAASVVFLTQSTRPDSSMTALFDGIVAADAAGCLRLASADRQTVIWPQNFSATARDGQIWVKNGSGQDVGQVGGPFKLGGGAVSTLHGIPLSVSDRQRAQESCPGSYWIVGTSGNPTGN